jgi:ACS family pantothenate transporter-like MFS transporter
MDTKAPTETQVTPLNAEPPVPKTRWERIEAVIWDGGYRSKEEKKLVRTLDIFIMYVTLTTGHDNRLMRDRSWATYGYFVRLLDSGNITNAYVSGMKEDLNFHGNQYNLLTTFFTCGYLIGQIPSQFLLTRGTFTLSLSTLFGAWY